MLSHPDLHRSLGKSSVTFRYATCRARLLGFDMITRPFRRSARSGRPMLAALIVAFLGPICTGHASTPSRTTLDTQSGLIIGTRSASVSEFLGIPYAAAPTGTLRFRPPAPRPAWTVPLQATAFGPACPQTAALGTPSVDEDCLTLNVFRPDRGGSKRPVLVFLFGGSFRYGSAGVGNSSVGPNYRGDQIARQTGAIVITVNYRLGVLGFLALKALDDDDPRHVSGNYGLLDQQAALQWIQANAPSFGGDPRRVTLFGQSAGALSIIEQMVSPSAAGLFSASELESFGALPAEKLATAEKNDEPIVSAAGCDRSADVAACLRTIPVADLLASNVPIGPNIDGTVIPVAPDAALSAGTFSHVPTVIGTDANEGTYFIANAANLLGHAITNAELQRTLTDDFGDQDAAAIETRYPTAVSSSPGQTLSSILTDEFFSCPALALRSQLGTQVATSQFEFSQPSPVHDYPVPTAPGINSEDAHTSELAYIFGHDGAGNLLPTGANRTLSDVMIAGLGGYAWNSLLLTPAAQALPAGVVVTLSTPIGISTDFATRHQCGFWSASGIKPTLIGHID